MFCAALYAIVPIIKLAKVLILSVVKSEKFDMLAWKTGMQVRLPGPL
ncbi:hypothetical protein WANA31_1120 [Wolbachia endosymbiont of Drosophila ananassae]|nr:hypothetical protein WANA31_1120 [Wolbachia endosymbiont of Drosophila ananassae]